MRTLLKPAAITVIALFALTACMRQDASYTLNEDNTVDGTIELAVKNSTEPDADNQASYESLFPEDVSAHYINDTVTPLGESGWTGERITLVGEPLSSFSTPSAKFEVKVDRVQDQFIVTGETPDPEDESSKQTIIDEGGTAILAVTFPGEVLEHNGTLDGSTVTWDMLTTPDAPYARGMAVPPEPEPEPEPEPVATPVATPSPSATPEPSPSATPEAVPTDPADGGIPAWLWAIGGALIAVVAGLVGYIVINRKPAAVGESAAPDAPASPEDTGANPPE